MAESSDNFTSCSSGSLTAISSRTSETQQKNGLASEISKKAGALRMKFTKKNDNNTNKMNGDGKKSKDLVPLRQCNCSCLAPRSESFYDIFLAPSVKASKEYRDLLVERHNRRNAAEAAAGASKDEENN